MTPEKMAIKILNDIAPYDVSQAVWNRQIGTISQALHEWRIDALDDVLAIIKPDADKAADHAKEAYKNDNPVWVMMLSLLLGGFVDKIEKLKQEQS